MPLPPDTVERIKRETIAALKCATQRHIDTGKIKKMLSDAEQRILMQVAPIQSKVIEHDEKLGEHDGFITRIRRNFLGIVKG